MLIGVEAPDLDFILNGCFYGLAVLAALSVVPWRLRERRNRWTLWLPAAALALYLAYETTMPARWDIRLDLLLIFPLLLIVVLAWLVRLVLLRRRPARLSAGACAAPNPNLPAAGEIFSHPVPISSFDFDSTPGFRDRWYKPGPQF